MSQRRTRSIRWLPYSWAWVVICQATFSSIAKAEVRARTPLGRTNHARRSKNLSVMLISIKSCQMSWTKASASGNSQRRLSYKIRISARRKQSLYRTRHDIRMSISCWSPCLNKKLQCHNPKSLAESIPYQRVYPSWFCRKKPRVSSSLGCALSTRTSSNRRSFSEKLDYQVSTPLATRWINYSKRCNEVASIPLNPKLAIDKLSILKN